MMMLEETVNRDEADKKWWNSTPLVMRDEPLNADNALRVVRVWRAFLVFAYIHEWKNVATLTASVTDHEGVLLVHTYKRWPRELRMLLRQLWALAGESRDYVHFYDDSTRYQNEVEYGTEDES